MKLTILQENLAKSVDIVSRFTSPKAQLPILGNILFKVTKSKVFLSSTNLEVSASVSMGAKIEEEGEISIPSKVFSELVLNLPKETVEFASDKEQIKIKTVGFTSTLLGMNSTDFPKIVNSVSLDDSIEISRELIAESLNQVIFATSTDETRPILTGVLFLFDKDKLSLVATDGFRLSRKIIDFKSNSKKKIDSKIVIPKGILNEIGRSLGKSENVLISYQESEKQIVVGADSVVLTSRLLEGEYPDFEKILPKNSTLEVRVDKEEFLRAVKLASIFARESANVVKIKILKDSVSVTAESSQSGNQETVVEAKIENLESSREQFETSYNYKFLEDFIHSVKGEEIKMEFTTSDKAGVFTDPKDPNYLHLIMPVRV